MPRLPAWATALCEASWTATALEELVAQVADAYGACCALQSQQLPLVAPSVCGLAAALATVLQHLATSTDAPCMRAGRGAELRAACGQLCMRLRDLFMPAAAGGGWGGLQRA